MWSSKEQRANCQRSVTYDSKLDYHRNRNQNTDCSIADTKTDVVPVIVSIVGRLSSLAGSWAIIQAIHIHQKQVWHVPAATWFIAFHARSAKCNILAKLATQSKWFEGHKGNIGRKHLAGDIGCHLNLDKHSGFNDITMDVLACIHLHPKSRESFNLRLEIEFDWIHRMRTMLPLMINTKDSSRDWTDSRKWRHYRETGKKSVYLPFPIITCIVYLGSTACYDLIWDIYQWQTAGWDLILIWHNLITMVFSLSSCQWKMP